MIVFAVFIFIPVKPLTFRIDFEIQIEFLALQNQEPRRNGETTTKSSEYNREKEMWKRARRTRSDENNVVEDCWSGRANQRYWRKRNAEGREEEDENSIFEPNITFTRSWETKKCDWKYDQMRFGSFLDFYVSLIAGYLLLLFTWRYRLWNLVIRHVGVPRSVLSHVIIHCSHHLSYHWLKAHG